MNSHITYKFREAFAELPADVQKQARQAYRLFKENPQHPSLRRYILFELGWITVRLAFARKVTSSGTGLVLTPNMTS
jgi:hypothetical protein